MEVLDFGPALKFPPVNPSELSGFPSSEVQNPTPTQLWSELSLPEVWPRRGCHVCLLPKEQPG